MLYLNALLYEGVMRTLYGRYFKSRLQSVAHWIPKSNSVLDLCCGPALVYPHLSKENQKKYLGIDVSKAFTAAAQRKGISVQCSDIWRDDLPQNYDCILLLSSLYQFAPHADDILEKMLLAAKEILVISEPIKNVSLSKNLLLKSVALFLTRPLGSSLPYAGFRYNSMTFTTALEKYQEAIEADIVLPGGRERMVVLNAKKWRIHHA